MKTYFCKTRISISVKLKNGKNRHLTFDPCGDGGILRVKTKDLQEAIEKREDYGKAIMLYSDDNEQEETPDVDTYGMMVKMSRKDKSAKKEAEVMPNSAEEPDGEASETVANEKVFDCFDDAREFLHETYKVAKKNLMSKAAVIKAGAEKGITITIND